MLSFLGLGGSSKTSEKRESPHHSNGSKKTRKRGASDRARDLIDDAFKVDNDDDTK